MNKLIVPSLIAAIAMFLWGTIFWMSPLPYGATVPIDNQVQMQQKIAQTFAQAGTYIVPSMMQPGVDQEKVMTMYEQGPNIIAYVMPGKKAFDPSVFIKGFVHYFVVSLLLAWLFSQAFASQKSFRQKFDYISKVAFVLVLFTHGSELIWWGVPAGWILWTAFYEFIAIVVSGVVLAKTLKVEEATSEPE